MAIDRMEEGAPLLEGKGTIQYATKRHSKTYISYVVVLVVLAVALLVATVVSAVVGVFYSPSKIQTPFLYHHAAVAADAPQCSVVGVNILRKGGTAVDAAVASSLCLGVVNLHSTGIGGGGFMVFYNASIGEATVVDFREQAPSSAHMDMYSDDPMKLALGPLAIAVPGQLRGMQYALNKFGRLPRSELFAPAIKLAREGFPVSRTIASAINENKDILTGNNATFAGLRELLAPGGKLLREGDLLRRPILADTLQKISEKGFEYFYQSIMTQGMVEEINGLGGNYSCEDFANYSVVERNVTVSSYKEFPLLSTPPPSAGAVLSMILSVLEGYDLNMSTVDSQSYHYMVESFKLSYAYRILLGDPAYNASVGQVADFMLNKTAVSVLRKLLISSSTTYPPEHYTKGSPFHIPVTTGTSHLSVLAENGDAVAVTTTINSYFGSKIRSSKFGLIFNNEMADFSIPEKVVPTDHLPPGPNNFVEPGKRPQSSTSPAVLLSRDHSRVLMVVGASGGSAITTGVAQVVVGTLAFELGLEKSISMPRLHHQLIPNVVYTEKDLAQGIVDGLEKRHHNIKVGGFGNNVQGIYVPSPGNIWAFSDPRKGGVADGY